MLLHKVKPTTGRMVMKSNESAVHQLDSYHLESSHGTECGHAVVILSFHVVTLHAGLTCHPQRLLLMACDLSKAMREAQPNRKVEKKVRGSNDFGNFQPQSRTW